MSGNSAQLIVIAITMVMANLPWLSQRCFLVQPCAKKSPWLSLLEWFVLYFASLAIALAVEYKTMGAIHSQGWEFYAVTFSLFFVFAFPGFIFRHIR